MQKILLLTLAGIVTASLFALPAQAAFTTVNITSYVNRNVFFNPSTFPTGLSYGNRGTGVLFDVAQFPTASGVAGIWSVGASVGNSLTVALTSFGISGQASVYALLNNTFGTPGLNEYNVTITATNNDTVTYQSIGGVDTRDYNAAAFSNTIANTTAEWFNNGIGQRFDVREFTLPVVFANDIIASFTITQANYGSYGDAALFSGLTFSDAPPVNLVPEPASIALLGAGLTSLGLIRRKRAG